DWLKDASPGKLQRLAFLKETLGLNGTVDGAIRYQLLHRTASPVLEAVRHRATYAAMVVHSFSASDACLEDYEAFARVLGVMGGKGRLERVPGREEPELWMGWVSGPAAAPARASRTRRSPARTLPALIAHADWGLDPRKRWMCVADLTQDGTYRAAAPEDVGELPTLLARLHDRAVGEPVLV